MPDTPKNRPPEREAAPDSNTPGAAPDSQLNNTRFIVESKAQPAPNAAGSNGSAATATIATARVKLSPQKAARQLVALAQSDLPRAIQQAFESKTIRLLHRLKTKDNAGFHRAMISLRQAGIKAKDVERLEKAVNAAEAQHQEVVTPGRAAPGLLVDGVPEAPDAQGLVVPLPWQVDLGGIYHVAIAENGRRNRTRKCGCQAPNSRK